ncbi:zinc ABC transporter permease [Malikia spinosa]|uniref:Metal ABC transporter permease n=2 Tax=Malikia spinosa TaxID=86180 RepID=A0A2S9KD11_9BURK|nr:metal ABC transporter permease [Malikia spinosa]PRD68265.1 zinc ABC transporter permease [Malikia spinosa]
MLDGLSLAGLWALLVEPFLEFGFMRRALAGCLALSVSAAPMGVFLMLRRMSMTGDAMAHAILPGAAIGYLFAGLSLGAMTIGGIVAGLVVAVASGLVARGTVLREDASMAAFYLISLALGVLIVSTRGNNVDLLHVLFGTVLSLDDPALWLLVGIAGFTLLGLAVLYRPLVLECLDPAFLRSVSRWSPVSHYGFLALLVINLVAGFHALGTLMSVGLMVLPAAGARFWTRAIGPMLALASGFALLACTVGLLVSYHADWPTSPVIVMVLGLLYLGSLLVGRQGLLGRLWRSPVHLKA